MHLAGLEQLPLLSIQKGTALPLVGPSQVEQASLLLQGQLADILHPTPDKAHQPMMRCMNLPLVVREHEREHNQSEHAAVHVITCDFVQTMPVQHPHEAWQGWWYKARNVAQHVASSSAWAYVPLEI